MYAVVETGGKQYRVQKGSVFHVEKLPGKAGDSVQLDNVLLVGGEKFSVGTPYVPHTAVLCKIRSQDRDKKIIVFRYKKREGFRKKIGHRQPYTELEVLDIDLAAKAKPVSVKPQAEPKKEAAPKAAPAVAAQKPVEVKEPNKPVAKKVAAPAKKKTSVTKTPKTKAKTTKKPTSKPKK